MPRSRSTINPSPVTVRKALRLSGDYIYLYLRTNLSKLQVEDMGGEAHVEYEYDEVQLRLALPETGVNMTAAEHYSRDQAALKRALRLAILDSESVRQQLKDAMGQAQAVDRVDNLSDYGEVLPVGVAQERKWAEARCVIVAPQDVSGLQTEIVGEYTQLVDVGSYRLWAANAPVDTLLALHTELWGMAPQGTLGVLAVVKEMGESFLSWGVRDATRMTAQEALHRRDRIASYLDTLGCDTEGLRAATDEAAQMSGIVLALGHTMAQLWTAMKR